MMFSYYFSPKRRVSHNSKRIPHSLIMSLIHSKTSFVWGWVFVQFTLLVRSMHLTGCRRSNQILPIAQILLHPGTMRIGFSGPWWEQTPIHISIFLFAIALYARWNSRPAWLYARETCSPPNALNWIPTLIANRIKQPSWGELWPAPICAKLELTS